MKTKTILKTLGLAVVMAVSTGAFANGWNDDGPHFGFPGYNNGPAFKQSLEMIKNVNVRQDQQLERILDGFYDKRINPVEFRKLMDEQTDIRKMERSFMADGFLNRFEFQKLDNALDSASKHIFVEAHDGQGKPGYGYGYGKPYNGPAPWNH
jgi:hypothetical protein